MTKAKKLSKAGRKPGPQGTLLPPLGLRLPPVLRDALQRLADQTAADTGNPRWSLPDEIRARLEDSIDIPAYDEGDRQESQALGGMMAMLSDEVFKITGRSWSTDNFSRFVLIHAFNVLLVLRFKAMAAPDDVPADVRRWAQDMIHPLPADPKEFAEAIGRHLAVFMHGTIERDAEHAKQGARGQHLRRIKRALGKVKEAYK